ncbi:MAG TPA: hypothetical protein ENJ37_07425, partial [Deltaproteobacteria bacterium]|nr:hypothetical protein [Deltaproteobacteria bacterium]
MRGAAEGEGGGPAVVELRGGPEELGHGHGEQVRDGVRAACEAVRAYLDRVRRFAPGSLVAAVLKLAARFMIGYAPADYRREMEALAEAAGVDRGSVFLLNAFDDIGANLACTAFAVLGGDDGVVLGRNLDYPVFTDEMCALSTVFRFRPASGRDFLSVAWPGYIGAVTAMNSAGLAVASLASPSPERTLRGVPLGLLYRRAVQYGKDLDDLVEVLRRGP